MEDRPHEVGFGYLDLLRDSIGECYFGTHEIEP